MFAVIFEVQPRQERWDDYLGLAGRLKPELEKIDGFIDNDRFRSRQRPSWVLSLSIWRDEKAVTRWRTLGLHHGAQQKGRSEIFEDYRLRVGEIIADTKLGPGQKLPQQRFDETEIGASKLVTVAELTPEHEGGAVVAASFAAPAGGTPGLVEHEAYESIYTAGKLLLLVSWTDAAAAGQWEPRGAAGSRLRRRDVRIIREYGMRDRREAPQYYPAAASPSD